MSKPTVAECIAHPLMLCKVVAEGQGWKLGAREGYDYWNTGKSWILPQGYRPDRDIAQAKALEPEEGWFSVTRYQHFGEGRLWHCCIYDENDSTSAYASTEPLARTLARALAEGWIER